MRKKCFPPGADSLHKRAVNRLTALLIAIAVWAGLYLPGLGSTEFKGEEGRRVMPAVTMLENGDWVVPYVGGEPFLRKPPLVQWCIAGSIQLFGQNPWAVRLPSAVSVLALAVVIVVATRGWLSIEQSLIAAVVMMTQVAMVDKCRLAELEAIYLSLSGIAMVLWMSWWVQNRSPWLLWTVPMAVNALAFLAKGPLNLLFFFAIVAAVTWRPLKLPGRVDLLLGLMVAGIGALGWKLVPAHYARWIYTPLLMLVVGWGARKFKAWPLVAGVALMVGIIALWAVPYYGRVDHAQLAETLNNQAVQRFTGADGSLSKWLLNLPSGIGDHLPWILFAPLLWSPVVLASLHGRRADVLRKGRWAVAVCFVGLLLIPGVLPRYVLPLTAPFSVLLAPALWESSVRVRRWWRYGAVVLSVLVALVAIASPFIAAGAAKRGADALSAMWTALAVLPLLAAAWLLWRSRSRLQESLHLTLWTALALITAMVLFATCAVPWMQLKDDLRPFARKIDAALPADARITAYNLGDYAPLLGVLFYLQKPHDYAPTEKTASTGPAYYLVRGKDREKFARKFRISGPPLAEMEGKDGEKPSVVVLAERLR